MVRYLARYLEFNKIIRKYDIDNFVSWAMLRMSSEQTCIYV